MNNTPFLEMKGVTKRFGSVVANKDINLTVNKGEILALLGENGSGKTTLMNMLSGIYYPDEGQILIDGNPVVIKSPHDALENKIGMVHQHFKLVEVFTATENIVLGLREKTYNPKKNREKVSQIALKYGFKIEPNKKIYNMSVSEKQTVEIVKMLYRGAELLILDEPTAVLTPQEIDRLFDVLRKMREDGKSIIIITHKLNEVMAISDRVSVLRKGEYIGTVNTSETSEEALTEMMVGKKVTLNINRTEPKDPVDRLIVKNLSVKSGFGFRAVDDVSFTARSGEILGIAGIAGSGQKELLEAIAGLLKIESGEITYFNPQNDQEVNLRDKTPTQIRDLGVRLSFVPEDRLGMGLVGNMDITDNVMLRSYRKGQFIFVDRKAPEELADTIVKDLEVVTPSLHTRIRTLSGGNVQKVLVGREISQAPKVLMAAYPVRGLDINSSYVIYNLLNKQKENGTAVIFVGEDLDVLMELCDRILVMSSGKVSGIVDGRTADKKEIGYLMTKTDFDEAKENAENQDNQDNQEEKEGTENE